jgi:Tfp pilus assembly protein PilF
MSVILDALRRARRGPDAPSGRAVMMRGHATTRLPTGLGLASTPPVAPRTARSRWFAIAAVIVIALGVWAAVQVAWRVGVTPGAPSPTPTRTTAARPPATAPAPAAPIVPPAIPQPSMPQPASAGTIPTPGTTPTARRQSAGATPIAGGHFERAVRYQTAGKLDEAAKDYLAAIAENDRHVEARNNLGLLYRSRGETTLAIEQFRRALAIDPRYVTARNHLAVLLIDAGRVADARRELDAGLSLDPRNVDLLVNLALVEKAERHDERAMELLLRALGDRPGHAAAHYNLAVLYDEQRSFALAYDHYTDFLAYAGPEYGAAVADVRRRVEALAQLLDANTH